MLFLDEFDGDRLDDTRWAPSDRSDLIYARDGVLNFVVTPADTRASVEASLTPKLSGPFREISFLMSATSFGESGPGGPSLTVRQAGGRNHQVIFGPSSGGLVVAPLVCGKESCVSYEDFTEPAEFMSFAQGEVVPIRVIDTGSRLEFFIRDQLAGQTTEEDHSALTEFSFNLFGADEESWHLTVDSLEVTT